MKRNDLINLASDKTNIILSKSGTGKTKFLLSICNNNSLFINYEENLDFIQKFTPADKLPHFLLLNKSLAKPDLNKITKFIHENNINNVIIDDFNKFYSDLEISDFIDFMIFCKNNNIKIIAAGQLPNRDDNVTCAFIGNRYINYNNIFDNVIVVKDKIEDL